MEESAIQTTADNKGRFTIPVHQLVGNSDIEAKNDNTAESYSIIEPAGGISRVEVNSDAPIQQRKHKKKKSKKRKRSPHHPLHQLAVNHIHPIQKMRIWVRSHVCLNDLKQLPRKKTKNVIFLRKWQDLAINYLKNTL